MQRYVLIAVLLVLAGCGQTRDEARNSQAAAGGTAEVQVERRKPEDPYPPAVMACRRACKAAADAEYPGCKTHNPLYPPPVGTCDLRDAQVAACYLDCTP